MVARLTPDQKAACSNHVGVKINFHFLQSNSNMIFVGDKWTNNHEYTLIRTIFHVTEIVIQKQIKMLHFKTDTTHKNLGIIFLFEKWEKSQLSFSLQSNCYISQVDYLNQ